jgi:hypothetical protein
MLLNNRVYLMLAYFILSLTLPSIAYSQVGARSVQEITVPLIFEGNRPYVEITLKGKSGAERTGKFLVDSGGGGFLLSGKFAKSLGLESQKMATEEGQDLGKPSELPNAYIGTFSLKLDSSRVIVIMNRDSIVSLPNNQVIDGMLPGHVLKQYHVVMDYPKKVFTIAHANVIKPQGTKMPMPVNARTGYPRTEIQAGKKTIGFLLDTGAAFSMVSEALLREWGDANPSWPRYPGAYGDAKLNGGMALETLIIPTGTWSVFELGEFGVVSQKKGVYEDFMSGMMTAPILGALAGNVLKAFRVEMDYPNQTLYLSQPTASNNGSGNKTK